jgi:hypothetical protein
MSYDKKYKEVTGRSLKADTTIAIREHHRLFKALIYKNLPENLSLPAWHAGLDIEQLFEITYRAKAEGFDVETYIRSLPRVKEMPLVRANIIDVDEEN